jgi:hypothetical protein
VAGDRAAGGGRDELAVLIAVPDTRVNRGANPRDAACFAPGELPRLRAAAGDLAWLLSRGYPKNAALKLVGDRHGLRQRQRTALQRTAASDEERARRRAAEVGLAEVGGREIWIDGYNVLLTVEVALGGGVVLGGRDGAFRDMASIGGHYRRVRQTAPALERVGEVLAAAGCARAVWTLDRPVSNSGRLRAVMEAVAAERGWPWEVRLLASPDRTLIAADEVVATADSAILDRARRWLNLARLVVERTVPGAWIVDLGGGPRAAAAEAPQPP